MRRLTLPLTALALLISLPLLAQGPRHGDGGTFGAKLAEFLELDEAQIADARALFEEHRAAAEELREQQQALRGELRELLDASAPDPTAIGTAILSLRDLRQELGSSRETFLDAFSKLLTPEQLVRFETLRDARAVFGHSKRGSHQPAISDLIAGPGA